LGNPYGSRVRVAPGTGTGWTFPTHEKPVPVGRVRQVRAGFFFVTESHIPPPSPPPPLPPPSASDRVIHKSPLGKITGLATCTGHRYGLGFSHLPETLTRRAGSTGLHRFFSLSPGLTVLHLRRFQLFLRRSVNADSCKLPSRPRSPSMLSISVSSLWERTTNQQSAKACLTPPRFSSQPFNFPSLNDIEAAHLAHPSSTRLCTHFFPFHLT
jgi:hypothetical protein